MIKRIMRLVMAVMMICTAASAQTTLKVGYVPGTGFLYEDRINHYLGYGYEYMEFLACYGDWKFEYVPSTTWQECGAKLQSGEIDVLPAMPGDYRTLPNVTRTDHVIGRYPMELVTKDGKIKPHMRLGTIASNPPIPHLAPTAQTEGFTYELVNYNLFYDMIESFNRNELDGYIAPMFEPNNPMNENAASIFDRQSYRLLVRSDRKDLLAAMNLAMDEMLMDQPNIRNRLNDKYLRTGGFPLILSRQEKEYLTQKKKLTTAIMFKARPYAYKNSKGELQGVIPRVIKQISKDLNIEIEILDTNSKSEVEQLIQAGKIDFVADTVCDFSWAETIGLTPTQSYLQIEYVAVTRRGDAIHENAMKAACDPNILYVRTFVMPKFAEDKIVLADNLYECFKLVSEGKADILYAPRNEVSYLIEETGSYNLEVASESEFSDSISLGVHNDSRLWRILNKEVNHLDVSKIRNVVNEDINLSTESLSPQWFIYHYPLKAMAIMLGIIALIITAAWYRAHMRRKHMNTVQQMAYTDSRYQMPNLSWLKSETEQLLAKYEEDDEPLYVVVFADDRQILKLLPYDKNIRNQRVKTTAEKLSVMKQVLLTAAGDADGSVVCVCRSKNDADIATLVKEFVQKNSSFGANNAQLWLNMKAGICKIDENDLTQSIEHAYIAQRQAQDVKMFNDNLQDNLTFEQQVEGCMEDALKNGEFQVWYQMEYDIAKKDHIGAEAFIRWQSSELGFLLPEKFIGIFERNNFILAIDYFVLEEVCKLQRSRLEAHKNIIPISTNQSYMHLIEDNYLSKMKSILKKYKLPKHSIKLEFKETAFNGIINREQRSRTINVINELRKIGFKVSVDNFGSGNSSYTLLNYLPIDEIKIDRSLLYAANDFSRSHDILESIIKLGKQLKIKVICEGIETKEQEQLLLNLGCPYGQGFLNDESRPPDVEFPA